MLAYTYIKKGEFRLEEKQKPHILSSRDAVVRVTLASICTSDLHIKRGAVPRAVPGITVGHEMVGVVEEVGSAVHNVSIGDRVCVNVETFCGECWFCRRGYVNNCTDKDGGWALGCRIDGGQAEYVRVPFADTGLTKIPYGVSDERALFTGDILATGYWAVKIAEAEQGDSILVIGAGPVGLCAAACARLKNPSKIIICEKSAARRAFAKRYIPEAEVVSPEDMPELIKNFPRGGADCVLECGGTVQSFQAAWKYARPNAVVVIAALYEEAMSLPLPDMYGKNLTFKTGGVDGCDCAEILRLISEGKIDLSPLITHTFPLSEADAAYSLFESGKDGVLKIALRP